MGAASPCGSQTPGTTIAGQLAPKYGFYCLINRDIPPESIQNTSNVLATLLGDEADDHVRQYSTFIVFVYNIGHIIDFVQPLH